MYQRNGIWWHRVTTPSGVSRRLSLGTKDKDTAAKVAAWAQDVADRLDRLGVLGAVAAGSLPLSRAFTLGEVGTAKYLDAQREEAKDRELSEQMVSAWAQWLRGRGKDERCVSTYRFQVEQAWPAPHRLSWLQPRNIITALDALEVKEQTKGRYRAAFGSLCQWLVRQGHLDQNPMPSVPGYTQSTPRDLWYSREDAWKLLNALPAEQRALEAVMWACGWEWSAIANATVGDFDLTAMTAIARGTKNNHRQRLTVITEPRVVPLIRAALADKLPAAKVWPGLRSDVVLKRHQRVCRALKLPVTTLHDWRHSFAVKELQRGRSLHFVAQMLGHSNTALVQRVYGRYLLSDAEVRGVAESVKAELSQNPSQSAVGM